MSILEYIKNELSAFSLVVNDVELTILIKEAKLEAEASLDTIEDLVSAKKIMVKFIPSLLGRPNITQGGYSISYNKDNVLAYLNAIRDELGLSELGAPTVRNKSNIW